MLKLNTINYIKKQYEKLYDCTANVYRYGKTTTPAGATRIGISGTPVISDMPCRISQKEINSPIKSQSESQNNISYEIKLFCSPEHEIKAGDRLEINKDGKIIKIFEVGEPFPPYQTHQEILLHRLDRA